MIALILVGVVLVALAMFGAYCRGYERAVRDMQDRQKRLINSLWLGPRQ